MRHVVIAVTDRLTSLTRSLAGRSKTVVVLRTPFGDGVINTVIYTGHEMVYLLTD